MPTQHRVSWHDADVTLGRDGAIHVSRRGQDYLTGYRPATLVLGHDTGDRSGRRDVRDLGVPAVETLPDEITLAWSLQVPDGSVALTLRHAFGPVWSQRWVVRSHCDRAMRVTALTVPLRPVEGAVSWLFGGGVESSLSVQPLDPALPTLGLWVQRGEIWRAASGGEPAEGLDLGRHLLAPHGTHVVDLSADFFPHPGAFARTVHRWLPARTTLQQDEAVRIDHPDAALTRDVAWVHDPGGGRRQRVDLPEDSGPHSGDVEEDAGVSEFVGGAGMERELEFHDARGRTELVLRWAPGLEALVAEEAASLLAGPRATNGAVRLPDATAGLLLQRALAGHAEIDPDEAADALDRLAAQPPGPPDPWAVLFACGEHQRTGDDEVLEAAVRTMLALPPQPAAGEAGSRLAVTLLAAGRDPAPVLRRLAASVTETEDRLTRWELLLVAGAMAGPRTALPDAAGVDPDMVAAEITARLGSGLLGRGLPDPHPVVRARLVLLLSMMVEAAGPWQDRLGLSAGSLVHHASCRVRWDVREGGLRGHDRRAALVWLSLAADPDA